MKETNLTGVVKKNFTEGALRFTMAQMLLSKSTVCCKQIIKYIISRRMFQTTGIIKVHEKKMCKYFKLWKTENIYKSPYHIK